MAIGPKGLARAAAIIGACVLIASVPSDRGEEDIKNSRDKGHGAIAALPSEETLLPFFPDKGGEIVEEARVMPPRLPVAAAYSFVKPTEVLPVKREEWKVRAQLKPKMEDPRAKAIDVFFEGCGCPLAGFGEIFTAEADKSGIPYALLPAIGFIESSGGKNLFRPNNPFGWGKKSFTSFEEAIAGVSAHLGGKVPETARYYGRRNLRLKLESYNPDPGYPDLVLNVLDEIMEIEGNLR